MSYARVMAWQLSKFIDHRSSFRRNEFHNERFLRSLLLSLSCQPPSNILSLILGPSNRSFVIGSGESGSCDSLSLECSYPTYVVMLFCISIGPMCHAYLGCLKSLHILFVLPSTHGWFVVMIHLLQKIVVQFHIWVGDARACDIQPSSSSFRSFLFNSTIYLILIPTTPDNIVRSRGEPFCFRVFGLTVGRRVPKLLQT